MTTRARVFATRSLPGRSRPGRFAMEVLQEQTQCEVWPGPGSPPEEVLRRAMRESEGLLCLLTDRIDEEKIASSPRLRVISSCSVGVDHIDVAAATRRGIPVGHTPGVLTETTADLAFGLLLAAGRRIPEGDRFVRAGQWIPERRWEPDMLLGPDLHGATLGVIGLGAIGRAVSRRALGFGMRVLGWNRSARIVEGVEPVGLDELLAHSDFVSVHVAYSPSTRGLLDREAIGRMKSGAVLVNTARGGIVDEQALVEALHAGSLAAAALDVFAEEPLPPESPLLQAPRLVLTPHIGSASVATRARMAELAVENLIAGLEGRRLPHCANEAVYEGLD